MLMPMLLNMALKSGSLVVDDDGPNIRLITKHLGTVKVLAKMSKEAFYQMSRTPEMPASFAEWAAQRQTANITENAPVIQDEPVKALADDPVPLPAPKRERPQLRLIEGGAA